MFIFDTDILSIFAKAGEIPLLHELFGDDMGMTPAVIQEIAAPIDYGYEFPYAVINTIKSVQMNNEAIAHHQILSQNKKLGKGECEAIAYCKSTSSLFITNDRKARETAIQFQVTVISLPALLRMLILKKIRTKDEVRALLNKMKKNDHLILDPIVENSIFAWQCEWIGRMIKAKKLSQRHYDIVDVQILKKPTDDQPADEQAQL